MPLVNVKLATLLPAWLAGGSVVVAPEQPLPIVGGTDAGACQFPTVVAMLTGGSATICSGTLLHPQVVLTAAHCVVPASPIESIAFGEVAPDAGVPAGTRAVAGCTAHPDYAEKPSTTLPSACSRLRWTCRSPRCWPAARAACWCRDRRS